MVVGVLLQMVPLNLRVPEGGIPCCSCPRWTDPEPFPGAGKKAFCDSPKSPEQRITTNRYVLMYLPYLNRQIKHRQSLFRMHSFYREL